MTQISDLMDRGEQSIRPPRTSPSNTIATNVRIIATPEQDVLARLGRMDGERFDAQLRQGSLDLRGAGGALEPVRTLRPVRVVTKWLAGSDISLATGGGHFTCYQRKRLNSP
jgi:hypothetical protein